MRPLYVVVGSDQLGEGEKDLGKLLMANFLKMLGGERELPSAIFFMNRGVFLATGSTDAVDFLKHLQEQGVSILLCQTCVEYYGIGKELALGEISGMGKLVEMVTSGRVAFV
jgi:selenium metabolism protein YedF